MSNEWTDRHMIEFCTWYSKLKPVDKILVSKNTCTARELSIPELFDKWCIERTRDLKSILKQLG